MDKIVQEKVEAGLMLPLMEAFYTLQGEGYHKGSAAYFIRIGGCDVGCHWCDVKESWEAEKHPPTNIESIVTEAKKYSDNQYDIYEHMSLGNLSRHYTYCGQLALMELSEYRTISYTNSILDFYYQLPIEHRFDARVLRKALLISDKRFYRLPSANHGYSAGF